ncbi:MAG: hypothetical protein QM729_03825 [Solirubrobacterales bacterium]
MRLPRTPVGRIGAAIGIVAVMAFPLAVRGPATTATARHRHGHRDRSAFHDPGYGVSVHLPPGWHAARSPLVPGLTRSREVFAAATFVPVPGTRDPCSAEPTASFTRMRPGDVLVTVEEEAPARATLLRHPDYFPPRPAHYDLGHTPWLHEQHMGEVPARVPLHFRAAGRFFAADVDVVGAPTPGQLHQVSAILTGLRFGRTPRGPISVPAGTIRCACGHGG